MPACCSDLTLSGLRCGRFRAQGARGCDRAYANTQLLPGWLCLSHSTKAAHASQAKVSFRTMPLLFGVLALLAATSTVTGQMVELSELEVNLPGSDVSVPSSFIIQGYTYVYDACQDVSFKTRRFYSDASTAADLGITTFSVPPSAQKIRVAGEATLGCTFTNETRCPNVSAVLDINWACNSPGPITGRYTADQHYPGNRLQTVQVGTYCPTGFPNVIAFKDGGVIKTGTQTSSTYGYDAKRTSSRYKAPGKNAGR